MPLFDGIGLKVLLVVALATAVTSRQYKVRDDDEGAEGKEYGDYYGDEAKASEQEDAKASAGFVEPIDFSSFFTAGFGNSPSGSSKIDSFFKPQGSELNPFALGSGLGIGGSAFPDELQASATTNNGSGFINPSIKFQSLFDSDSAATVGFRPQDFLKRSSDDGDDDEEDGITEETAPSDFFSPTFSSVDDDFASTLGGPTTQEYRPTVLPTKAYPPSVHSLNKQNAKLTQGGKSSYPAPTRYPSQPQYGSPTPASTQYYGSTAATRPQTTYRTSTRPSSIPSYNGYPTKSASTYNPSGPYVSKPGYKSTGVDKSQYKTYPAPSYDSKSVYPKKASEFYPSKVGQRPTPSSFRPTPAQTKLSPRYQFSSAVHNEGKARYVAPQDYYKFGPSEEEAESKAEYSTPSSDFSPYVTSRESSSDKQYFVPTSSPYAPSEYGKEDDYHDAEPAEKEEIKINPANDKKNCRKIEKKLNKEAFTSGRFRREAMTCYACDNPKTGGTFEKCLYDSSPDGSAQDYFRGHASSYSDKLAKPKNVRLRRDVESQIKFDNAYSDVDFDTLYSEPLVRIARQQPSSSYEKSYEDYISKFASPSKKNYQYEPEHYTPHSHDDEKADYKTSPTTNADQNCKTVVKGTSTCSVCQNPKTGGQSEQCSYATSPKENNYFVARQSSFNTKKPRGKGESRQSRQEPRSGNYGTNDGPSEGYYSRKSIAPYDHSSEVAAAVTKKGSYKGPLDISPSRYNNRRSDDPAPQKYNDENTERFKQYNNDDDDDGGDGSSKQEYNKEQDQEPKQKYSSYKNYEGQENQEPKQKYSPYKNYEGQENQQADRRSDDSNDDVKKYYDSSRNYDDHFKAVFPELAGQESKNARSDDEAESDDYEDASQTKEVEKPVADAVDYYKSVPIYYYPDVDQKKDLEKVLGEFSQKDRSSCKKVVRDKMTCYQCVDKKGMQHEECMFVAASEPKSQHLAYHELKEFRLVPDKAANTATLDSASAHSLDTKQTATTTPEPSTTPPSKTDVTRRRRVRTTSTTTRRPSLADRPARRTARYAKSLTITVKTPASSYTPRGQPLSTSSPDAKTSASERREARTEPDEEKEEAETRPEGETRREEEEPAPKEGEFEVDREGLYSAETRAVFDPVLKIYLPEYMLTRSEHEEIFDEVMKNGR